MQTLTNQMFTYRKSPALQDGVGRFDKIKGKTICWNQLIEKTASSATLQGVTFTNNGDGSFTVNGTASASVGFVLKMNTSCTPGTVFYLKGCPSGGSPNVFSLLCSVYQDSSWKNEYYETGNGLLITNQYNYYNIQILIRSGVTVNNLKFVPQLFDLTSLKLSDLSLTEVKQWFADYFPLQYYDYCKGSLISLGGRNVNFNQQLFNGNFANTDNWSYYRCTLTTSGNIATITSTDESNGNIYKNGATQPKVIAGHKYLFTGDMKYSGSNKAAIRFRAGNAFEYYEYTENTWASFKRIITASISGNNDYIQYEVYAFGLGGITQLRNAMCVDLTQMFGAGNEPSVQGFESLFPDPYYAYTLSRYMNLVSDVSLKTTGKNLLKLPDIEVTKLGVTFKITENVLEITGTPSNYLPNVRIYADGSYETNEWWPTASNIRKDRGFFDIPIGLKTLTSFFENGIRTNVDIFIGFEDSIVHLYSSGSNIVQYIQNGNENYRINYICFSVGGTAALDIKRKFQLELGLTSTSYEPYETSTLSLPILDYFPDGEMSVGSAFDELTKSKATTRVGSADIDDFSYGGSGSSGGLSWFNCSANSVVGSSNLETNYSLQVFTDANRAWGSQNPCIVVNTSSVIRIYDSSSSLADFKLKYPNLVVNYELSTPTEVTIDPPLDLIFDAWKDGTEQLLPENGIVPVTAPMFADMSYSSAKIQVVTHPNPIPGGETSGDGWFLVGEEATINAVPNEHYIFKNWELDNEVVSTDPEYTFEVENE